MSTMNADKATALRRPFPKESVGKLPKPTGKDNQKGKCNECGGWHGLPAVHLDYVGHAAVTDRLLTVDPEWTWRPFNGEEIAALPPILRDGGLWIMLTVCGVTKPGFGDAQGKSGPNAVKEMIGDAIRNAAMRFGVSLDLWAKENLVEFAEAVRGRNAEAAPEPQRPADPTPEPEPPAEEPPADAPRKGKASPAQVRKMGALMGQLGMSDRDLALAYVADVIGHPVESRNDLTSREASQVIDALQKDAEPAKESADA